MGSFDMLMVAPFRKRRNLRDVLERDNGQTFFVLSSPTDITCKLIADRLPRPVALPCERPKNAFCR
jgi:hypothetical protein